MAIKHLGSFVIAAALVTAVPANFGAEKGAPLPPECKAPDLSSYGNPTFALERKDLSVGISLPKHQFHAGEPIVMRIWIDNARSRPANVWSCMHGPEIGLDFFKWKGFDLYSDTTGQRLFDRSQQEAIGDGSTLREQCRTDVGRFKLQGELVNCNANGPIPIPANACVTGGLNSSFDLLKCYDLPVGRYTIRFRGRVPNDPCRSITELPSWHGYEDPNLTFSVIQH